MAWFVFFRSGITFWPPQPSFHIQYAFICPGMDTYTQIRCSNVLHILDNFFLAEALPCASNLTSLGHLLCLFIELNVSITPGKTFAPSQSLKFLKITLDSVHMLALLPTHKLDRAFVRFKRWVLESEQMPPRSLHYLRRFNWLWWLPNKRLIKKLPFRSLGKSIIRSILPAASGVPCGQRNALFSVVSPSWDCYNVILEI